MALTMREKKKIGLEYSRNYLKARKKEKGRILDNFTEITGYNRNYASRVLRDRRHSKRRGIKRKKKRKYGEDVRRALEQIWSICDCICGKRLKPFLKEVIPILEENDEIHLTEEVKDKLLKVSSATIDRILAPVRRKERKGRSTTKPGTLLKHQIPIKTFSEWDENDPGFLQIDLVSHEGGNPKGDHTYTLDVTDVHTGWVALRAIKNKAQIWTVEALRDIVNNIPFKVQGIDSDNGSEFINAHLLKFCEENGITFTRSRRYKKNDNCFVEQKNYSVVRRYVGYYRYDTAEEMKVMNELYRYLEVYRNFFQPVMKLKEKVRVGSKVVKRYDEARTPYRRLLETRVLTVEKKKEVENEYNSNNPAELRRKIMKLQKRLLKLIFLKEEIRKKDEKDEQDFEYII